MRKRQRKKLWKKRKKEVDSMIYDPSLWVHKYIRGADFGKTVYIDDIEKGKGRLTIRWK